MGRWRGGHTRDRTEGGAVVFPVPKIWAVDTSVSLDGGVSFLKNSDASRSLSPLNWVGVLGGLTPDNARGLASKSLIREDQPATGECGGLWGSCTPRQS